MYQPPHFRMQDEAEILEIIRRRPLGLLITNGAGGLMADPIPFLYFEGAPRRLVAHLARANPQIASIGEGCEALVVFQAENAYVSPGWYAAKREHGKVVPTWNYAVVHARGTLSMFEDRDRLLAAVDRLTGAHEGRLADPWSTSDAPPDYIASQLKGIIGIELAIHALEGKHKLGQNRSAADRQGIVDGLQESERPADAEIAAATRRTLEPKI